jgi:hypothetical protein
VSAQEHARFAQAVERLQDLMRQKLEQRERDSLPAFLRPQAD